MKKFYSYALFSSLLIVNGAFGQITIDNTDFATAGDEVFFARALDLSIDYASTGANYNWSFTDLGSLNDASTSFNSLSGVGFLVNMTYGPMALTNYRATYRTPFEDLPLDQVSNFLPVEIGNINQYSRITNQRFTIVGYSATISGQEIPIKSDTIEIKYVFPLEYGNTYQSRGYTALDMSAFVDAQWKQKRQRISEVDGWGTLTTDFGTFDVLRVKHQIQETDSIIFSGTAIGVPIPTIFEYEWIAKGQKSPIIKIVTSVIAGNETVTSIEVKQHNVLAMDGIQGKNEFSIYPNPVTDEVNFQFSEGEKSISIYGVDGSLIHSFETNSLFSKFSSAHLQAGMYLVNVQMNGQTIKSSFVKK